MSTQTTSSRLKTPVAITWLTVDQWQSYVEGHEQSSIFHHRKWLELLYEEYGFGIQIPAFVDDGKIRAAIPFLQTRSLRMKKKLISLPFSDYLRILADDQQAMAILVQLIHENFRGKADTVVIRSANPVAGLENGQ